jgi:hypothetical protein
LACRDRVYQPRNCSSIVITETDTD